MRNPVIEDFILWNVCSRFLERNNTPSLHRICGVGPYPFSGSNKPLFLENSAQVLKGSGVMCAATMSDNVVDDAEVWKGDELPASLLVYKMTYFGFVAHLNIQ